MHRANIRKYARSRSTSRIECSYHVQRQKPYRCNFRNGHDCLIAAFLVTTKRGKNTLKTVFFAMSIIKCSLFFIPGRLGSKC